MVFDSKKYKYISTVLQATIEPQLMPWVLFIGFSGSHDPFSEDAVFSVDHGASAATIGARWIPDLDLAGIPLQVSLFWSMLFRPIDRRTES